MMKRLTSLVFVGILLSSLLGAGSVGANREVTVILVSDNPADSALAQYLANLTGAIVVVTPWGVYDPNVSAQVIGAAPDQVIIIGGPDAVSALYEEDFKELNITVTRWWGENRYETNVAVIGNATLILRIKFQNSLVVVPGNDSVAIEKALEEAMKVHGFILFANNSTDPIRIIARFGSKPENITIVETPITAKLAEKLRDRIEERAHIKMSNVSVNITREMALKAIEDANKTISLAAKLLNNASDNETGVVGGRNLVLSRFLMKAELTLEKAQKAYEEGNYGKAYGLATAARAQVEPLIKLYSKEWQGEMKKDPKLLYGFMLYRIHFKVNLLEQAGINDPVLQKLIDQLKEAIQKGEYDIVPSLLQKIRERLVLDFMGNKNLIREKIYFPVGGKHHHWEP